jgi:hypothetical protein
MGKRLKRPHSTRLCIRPTTCGAYGLAARLARWAESAPGPATTTTVAQPAHAGARAGRSPRTGPTRWRGHRRPAMGQDVGALVGLAPAGERVGAEHSRATDAHRVGDVTAGREEEGRRGGASRWRGCSRDFDGAEGSPTAPRGKMRG